ncbi:hypothetical protein PVAND_008242 [Polypedilum vanderplanki]|uniref:F-box domain-containing protein n=1 Tax=Polypedilum vanderplanki TaxID=319348 RepID=A0A9J6C8V5_POLVA|nr:hypothetical protein PVAND_008242 [Polypedilum vanderplanki]
MNVDLVDEMKPHASTLMEVCANSEITVKNESENCTETTTKIKTTNTEISVNDTDDSTLLALASLPKAEIKLKKLEETKLLMDNNENSLSVDTLIEILSSNSDNKLPIIDDVKKELEENGSRNLNNINVPPSSIPSTLNSPSCSSSSSSSKMSFSSPNEALPPSSFSPSPSSIFNNSPKKFPSPHYPNGGKPMLADMNKKMKQGGATRKRAKPKAVYQSQISDNSVGIKLCIKKSINTMPSPSSSSSSNKSPKKRSRKSKSSTSKTCESDSEDSYVKKRKKRSVNNSSSGKTTFDEPKEQSGWGKVIPREVLLEIFKMVVKEEGSIPTLCRLMKVCLLWREVALDRNLWRIVDLSTYYNEKDRTEVKLKSFIKNFLIDCEELNISYWKVANTECVLAKLYESSPGLRSISLCGWRTLTNDNLYYLAENFSQLARLDLSSINTEMNTSKTAVGLQSLVTAIEKFNERLTHLNLSDNRLSGIPQITQALTKYCPNLTLLDLSNVKTVAVSHAMLHIEKLQEGCQKLKVLRIANSHVQLSNATLQEQMQSPGFPELEELSVASLSDESRLMSDEALQRILKSSTKLKLLDVRGCARLTHDSLIRIPAWDLKHLFLSGCSVTRDIGSGLELIASKWAHSLIEFDLAWATHQVPLDNALRALADKRDESPLNHLNLCGSAVSVEAVKEILENCKALNSINLSSCRGLPRGIKRQLEGHTQLNELRENLRSEH